MKEKKFENKLAAYSALAAGILTIGSTAQAQIIHTDVDPDETLSGATADYDLDMNNDGVPDFQIQLTIGTSSSSVRVLPMTGNEVLGSDMGFGFFYPFAMDMNDAINSAQATWNGTINGGYLTMGWMYTTGAGYGNWFGASDKYLGLRFVVGSNWHYGWVRMDVSSDASSTTIKEFAYNSAANTGLLAGQTTGIEEGQLSGVSAYTYGNTLFLNLNDNYEGNVHILNLMGQEVKVVAIDGNNMEISLSDLSSGVYMVQVQTSEGSYARKVSIK